MPNLGEYEGALYAQNFRSGIDLLPQQMGSKLSQFCRRINLDGAEVAWSDYVEPIDETTAITKRTTRNATTAHTGMQYVKRGVFANRYPIATLTDNMDLVRSLNDPQNTITQEFRMAQGRKHDRIILDALGGTAQERTGAIGSYTFSGVSFPSGQSIAVNYVESGSAADSNLTIGKLRQVRYLFEAADVDVDSEMNMPIYVGHAKQKHALLRTTEVTSADYAAIKALVNGEVDTFLGMRFVWFGNGPNSSNPFLPIDGSNVRTNFAFIPNKAVTIGDHPAGDRVRIGERDDLNYVTQIFMDEDFGAVRNVEELVVRVYCDEDL